METDGDDGLGGWGALRFRKGWGFSVFGFSLLQYSGSVEENFIENTGLLKA